MKIEKNPIESFINRSTSGSIILIVATAIALIWANSPWHESYTSLWSEDFAIGFNNTDFIIVLPLYLWVNNGLMTIFFFSIGLEIKREILDGELTTMRKASMPLFAALGGMIIPIGIFLLLNNQDRGSSGWGIPMATDIAFTLGILRLLGKRVPLSLKVFLTAFAVIDDMGAILVIGIFYSHEIQFNYLLIALAILIFLAFLNYKNFHSKYILLICSVAVWILFLVSGIHPTISGVLLALIIPSVRSVNLQNFFSEITQSLKVVKKTKKEKAILSEEQQDAVDHIDLVTDRVQSPMQQLERGLSGWVAIIIMPVFALANAGIRINLDSLGEVHIISQIAIAMVAGKIIGITSFSYLAHRLNLAQLPKGISFKNIIGIGFLGGMGFTMSLFIAELAFRDNDLLTSSKIGILLGSLVAGIIGYLILHFQLSKSDKD